MLGAGTSGGFMLQQNGLPRDRLLIRRSAHKNKSQEQASYHGCNSDLVKLRISCEK